MKRLSDSGRRTAAAGRIGATAVVTAAIVVGASVPASGHGYVGGQDSAVTSRAANTSNSGLGAVRYEPQSVEGAKGFPDAGPADGRIASGGVGRFHELDEQSSSRWVKNPVSPGSIDIGWTYTAVHATSKWHYYITKPGWDQNAPLTRDMLEPIGEVLHDGSLPAGRTTQHSVTIPSDRQGYHVVLGVWDIADTGNAFYQVVDLEVGDDAGAVAPRPSAPQRLVSTGVTSSSAGLSWTAPSTGRPDHYRVFRDGKQIGRTNETAFTDTGLSPRTKHTYYVVAVSGAQSASDPSNTITVTTSRKSDAKRPGAPLNLHTMTVASDVVDLMWSAPSGGTQPVRYLVQRAGASGEFTVVGTSETTRYVDASVAASTHYRYRVVAVDKAGNASKPSEVIHVTTESTDTGGSGEAGSGENGSGEAGSGENGSGENGAGENGSSAWDSRAAYVKGDIVTYNGHRYVCIQSYQGHGDPNWIMAPSLWTKRG